MASIISDATQSPRKETLHCALIADFRRHNDPGRRAIKCLVQQLLSNALTADPFLYLALDEAEGGENSIIKLSRNGNRFGDITNLWINCFPHKGILSHNWSYAAETPFSWFTGIDFNRAITPVLNCLQERDIVQATKGGMIMPPTVQDPPSVFFSSEPTFSVVVQQWAKARIDVPMQVIARFDDAAKQLITIGTTLQGLYIAVFTFGGFKASVPVYLLASLSAPLVLLIFFAAQAICTMPLKKEAFDTYELFKARPGLSDQQLTNAVDRWCQTVDAVADKKHRWLWWAKAFLVVNACASLVMLVKVMYMR